MVVGDANVPVDLAPVPPKPLEEIFPVLGRWKQKRLQDRNIRDFNQWLQDSRAYVEERGIPVHLIAAQETFHRLLGELSSRGWKWDYGPGGRGHEIRAEKPNMTIRFSAETPVDVATLVLATAIKDDEQQGG
jgi:hypothetical protein